MIQAAHLANLLLAGMLLGNEFGTWAVVHRGLASMPAPDNIRAEQALSPGYARLMPILISGTILSAVVVAVLLPEGIRSRPWWFMITGITSASVMLAITLAGTLPINIATMRLPAHVDPAQWRRRRRDAACSDEPNPLR